MQQAARQEVTWATAVRAMDAQHRTTTWLRLGLVVMLWSVLPWSASDDLVHGVCALAVVTVGVLMAHVHARPTLIDFLDRLPGMGALVSHLTSTRGRAIADLPGLLEGVGILIVGLAYVGPWGVAGMPPEATLIALVATVAHTHSVFLNVVLDPGFYAPVKPVELGPDRSADPPRVALRWVRHAIPPGLAILAATLTVPAWNPELAAVSVSLRALLSTSFLLIWLVWICFDQVLEATTSTVEDCEELVRTGAAQDLHSLAKNSIVSVLKAVESPHFQRSEVRGLTRNALVQLEEMRLSWLSPDQSPAGGRLEDLWEATVSVLTRDWREKCHLDEAARGIELRPTDYQLVRRLLSDLVTNALKADAEQVHIEVGTLNKRQSPRIQVTVTDDGPGMPPDVLHRPMTSLAVLERELRRFSGTLTFRHRVIGTSVVADWESR
ncbi:MULTISPECIES: ATP-binding protein [unclassified Streptomyces]|uniref:ATP-binding protein n=1 Tax=unclassified Streptomyces TaxID=2593676 RepID=UPI003430AC9F